MQLWCMDLIRIKKERWHRRAWRATARWCRVFGFSLKILTMCFHSIENVGSNVPSLYEIQAFHNCLDAFGLLDLRQTGCFFTWNNKHELGLRLFKNRIGY